MALPHIHCSNCFLIPSSLPQPSSMVALRINSAVSCGFKNWQSCSRTCSSIMGLNTLGGRDASRQKILCSMNMSAGQSGEHGKFNFDHITDQCRKLWDSSPQPVKKFPWGKAAENFIQLIVDLVLAVIKYLCIPVFVVSSVSELSYCAHERKLYLVPLPFLVGAAVAGILRTAALEASPTLKNSDFPWHLMSIAIFFTLVKLPGPYYPYWGRIFIPHVANGALLRTLWFAFLWSRRPQKPSESILHDSTKGSS